MHKETQATLVWFKDKQLNIPQWPKGLSPIRICRGQQSIADL